MASGEQASAGNTTRRTARKSTAGLPYVRTATSTHDASPKDTPAKHNVNDSEVTTPKRYGFRQRTPARQQPDYVYENDPDAFSHSQPITAIDGLSTPRKRGRPPKNALSRDTPQQAAAELSATTTAEHAPTLELQAQTVIHEDPARTDGGNTETYEFAAEQATKDTERTDDESETTYSKAGKPEDVNASREAWTCTEPSSEQKRKGRIAGSTGSAGGGAETWNHVMNCSEEKAVALCRAADWIYHDQRTSARGIRVVQYNCKFLKRAHWAACRAKLKLIVHSASHVEMWRFGSHVHTPLNVIMHAATASASKTPVKTNQNDAAAFSEEFARVERLLLDGKVPEGGTISRRSGVAQRVQIHAQTQAFIDAYLKVKPYAKPSAVLAAIQQRGLPVPSLKQLYNRLAKMNRARRIGTVRRANEFDSTSNSAELDRLTAELQDQYADELSVQAEKISATPSSHKSVVVVYPRSAPLALQAKPAESPVPQTLPQTASGASTSHSTQSSKVNEIVRVIKPPSRTVRKSATATGTPSWSSLLESPADAILKWSYARDRQLDTVLKRMRNEPLDELEAIEMVKGDPRDPANTARRDAALFSLQLHTPIVVNSSGPDESEQTGVSWCLLLSTVAMLKLAAMHKQVLQIDTSVCVLWQQRVRVAMVGTSDSTQQFRCVCLVVYELLPNETVDSQAGVVGQNDPEPEISGSALEANVNAAQSAAAINGVQAAGLSHTTLEFVLRTLKGAIELVARSIRVQTQTDDSTLLSESDLDNEANSPYQPAAVVCNYDEGIFRAVRAVFGGDSGEKTNTSDEASTDESRAPRIAMCAKQVERDLKAHCPSAVWVMAPFVQKNLKVLGAALNESQFLKGAELFYNEFSDYQGLGSELHKFCVYLKRCWIDEPLRRRWFAGYLPAATAKSNEGLHDRIGQFRDKYRLLFANDADRFLSWICRAVQEWSDSDWHAAVAADSNRRLHVYALEEFLAASAWSNEQFKFIHISVQAGPGGGSGGSQQQEVWLIADGTCSKYRKFFDDPTHSAELLYSLATDYADITTWKEYRLRRTQLLVVTKRLNAVYHCSCIDHLQTALCKHSLGMAIRNGELAVPDDINTLHHNAALGNAPPAPSVSANAGTVVKKRPPGRPKQMPMPPNASTSELKHLPITDQSAMEIDPDLGLRGPTAAALDAANLVDYYDEQADDAEADDNDADVQGALPMSDSSMNAQ